MKRVYTSIFLFIDKCSNAFTLTERGFDLILFWLSFFSVEWQDTKNGHFLRGEKLGRKNISNDEVRLSIAKEAIEKMESEYKERKAASSDKVKVLFQILTLIFTVISASLTFLVKDLKFGINFMFSISLMFSFFSLFMVLTYYKVSFVNEISFTDADCINATAESFLADKLWCIEMNNARLNYNVTIYKSALRYFYAALICLIIALYMQFKFYFYSRVNIIQV